MKASLSQREPMWVQSWKKAKLYESILENRASAPIYTLHDGPPYANGHIHMGHALNKILKDFVVKFKTLQGFKVDFIPGWDCHGLPVEHQLLKELGKTKNDVDQVKFRRDAAKFAKKFVKLQKDEFIRLGILGNWEDPYLTLDPNYEADTVEVFGKLFLNHYIYKALKPITWCSHCETALAEAEVEYLDHISKSVYVKFELNENSVFNYQTKKPIYFVIWTTTPWTLPANQAVAVKDDLTYQLIENDHECLVILKERISVLEEILGKTFVVQAEVLGRDLKNQILKHPFIDKKVPIVLADYVTTDQGSGCVHIAPGHGQDDFETGKEYQLEVYSPVNEQGKFIPDAPVCSGVYVFDANDQIIEILKNNQNLIHHENYEHSYPHCWRCKSPIIFRATAQWFLKIDHENLRQKLIEEIHNVHWLPEAGIKRIMSMIESRPDWCLSRQRLWGCPIPVFYCLECNEDFLNQEILTNVLSEIRQGGAGVWFQKDVSSFLPPDVKCPKCNGTHFKKETDILDVWFDSGSSHQAVIHRRKNLNYPADLYLEGSDQHRGWFQSSLILGVALGQKSPFKEVLTHGFIVDEKGQKMSKSQGNVISPQEIYDQYGADILRLWVASVDYSFDVKLSQNNLQQTAEAYKKIRNTFKYLLGNLHGFDFDNDQVFKNEMFEIDLYCLKKLYDLEKELIAFYQKFEFHRVFHSLYHFCVIDLSSFYLDVLKDRLYTYPVNSLGRRSAQTVLWYLAKHLSVWFSPILSFTSDEVWKNLYLDQDKIVHLECWPKIPDDFNQFDLLKPWEQLIDLRNQVNKKLEILRQEKVLGSALEAEITLHVKEEKTYLFLQEKFHLLMDLFIVSDVLLKHNPTQELEYQILVQKSSWNKCERCWHRCESVGKHSIHATICHRCIEQVEECLQLERD